MKRFRFAKLKIYQLAKELHHRCLILSNPCSRNYLYLIDQLKRAALSVILNIAEGSGKESSKDFRRYLMNSLGSINEVAACLDVAFREGLMNEKEFKEILDECWELKNRIGYLAKKIKLQLADSRQQETDSR